MPKKLALRRLKWAAQGIRGNGLRDFRTMGIPLIEIFQATNGILRLDGWARPFKALVEPPSLEILQGDDIVFSTPVNTRRSQDAEAYFDDESIGEVGLFIFLHYESGCDLFAQLRFKTRRREFLLPLGAIKKNAGDSVEPTFIDPWEHGQLGEIDLGYMQLDTRHPRVHGNMEPDHRPVDIIIPVYNGFEYLEPLFDSLKDTEVPYRLIVVDDASPDERIKPLLDAIATTEDNVMLIENKKNRGFVHTVNHGIESSEHDVVILNTDTELPAGWLERLMRPLWLDSSVASATPFTNSGTICSFPKFLENNELFDGLPLETIDDQFRKMIPVYTEVPTGVGFCMALSKKAIDEIGTFDEKSFGKGYGEENDWCQRAIAAGYKNVIVENLFVYHKHGGSFESDEKQELCKKHEKRLLKKHPDYLVDVARFCEADPLAQFRSYVASALRCAELPPVTLAFSHLSGGGAAGYLERQKAESLEKGKAFALLTFEPIERMYHLNVEHRERSFQCCGSSLASILSLLEDVEEVWINELASYEFMQSTLETITEFVRDRKLPGKILVHDFYMVCPSINLLDDRGRYCGIPSDLMRCEACYKTKRFDEEGFGEDILAYRDKWLELLSQNLQIICFSENSKQLLARAFPEFDGVVVHPHEVEPLEKVRTNAYDHEGVRIGFIGKMTYHKGVPIIRALAEETRGSDVSLVLFGDFESEENIEGVKVTGEYRRDDLSRLLQSEEIDLVMIPSIWPETFSYTCSEAISTGLPVASFDLGAPAERVATYERGLVLPLDISPSQIVEEIKQHLRRIEDSETR